MKVMLQFSMSSLASKTLLALSLWAFFLCLTAKGSSNPYSYALWNHPNFEKFKAYREAAKNPKDQIST